MLKFFKNVTTFTLSAITAILACGTVSVYAVPSDDSIYIESPNVPIAATNYAQDMFSHLCVDDLEYIGFTYDEACNMRLAPGFFANGYNSTINTSNVYYYPVLHNNDVVALFTVTEDDNEYSYQFGNIFNGS